jgi:hypothetical protein
MGAWGRWRVQIVQWSAQKSGPNFRPRLLADRSGPEWGLTAEGPDAVPSSKIEPDPAPIGAFFRPLVLRGIAAMNALLVPSPVAFCPATHVGEVGA